MIIIADQLPSNTKQLQAPIDQVFLLIKWMDLRLFFFYELLFMKNYTPLRLSLLQNQYFQNLSWKLWSDMKRNMPWKNSSWPVKQSRLWAAGGCVPVCACWVVETNVLSLLSFLSHFQLNPFIFFPFSMPFWPPSSPPRWSSPPKLNLSSAICGLCFDPFPWLRK